ncbi:hypothetical protein J7S20_04190 [Sphingomonadaceae bacterium LXI357]|uniref:Uncharacterized protein n=1 Tax=Stakelama marina TaxID=2826939 RepID=A0A8T4IBD0_9SPHN|nr:DUF6629 family protein [Stakelama marina]MBR0551701.1 hypothetical protein [Stakelama marina]
MREVKRSRALLFGATPLLFALHQFVEAFVWLGLEGRIGTTAFEWAVFLFMLYAQGILPLLMPLAVLLLEPRGWRRHAIAACTALGAVVFARATYAVLARPTRAVIEHHSIAYHNAGTDAAWIAGAYVVATCAALLLSSHRVVRWFGIANVIGLTIVLLVKGYAFTSVWCLYAAVLSIMLFWQFRHHHVNIDRPNCRPAQ